MSVDIFEDTAYFLQVPHSQKLRLCHCFINLLNKVLLEVAHGHWVEPVYIQVLVALHWLAKPDVLLCHQLWVVEQLNKGNLVWTNSIIQHALLHSVFQVLQDLLAICHAIVVLNLHLLQVLIGWDDFTKFSDLLLEVLVFALQLL